MALGMRNLNHYFPDQEYFQEATKKTLTALRTWEVSAKSHFSDRALNIEQDGMTVYSTQSHFTVKKDHYVTIHNEKDTTSVIAGVTFEGQDKAFRITLGDPQHPESGLGGQDCEAKLGGNLRTFQHKFSPPTEQRDYAWRETQPDEITIADSQIEVSSRDWKFISLTPEGEEDEVLAVYVHDPKASMRTKSQICWFADVPLELEQWGLAAVVGLVERKRKTKDRYGFMSMVGMGATM